MSDRPTYFARLAAVRDVTDKKPDSGTPVCVDLFLTREGAQWAKGQSLLNQRVYSHRIVERRIQFEGLALRLYALVIRRNDGAAPPAVASDKVHGTPRRRRTVAKRGAL